MRLTRNLRPERRTLPTNQFADEIRRINLARALAALCDMGCEPLMFTDDLDREAVPVATVAAGIVAELGGAK